MRTWKKPNRPNNEISKTYNDGIVTICEVEDKAEPGYKPNPEATPKIKLRYEEQRLGINRAFLGRQIQVEIDRVMRVPKANKSINPQDVAVTEDGRQYRIELVQTVSDVYPPSLDLTLSRIVQKYEVPNEMV